MLTQLLGWAATVLGLLSTWQAGRNRRAGWLLGAACCAFWLAVNMRAGIWAGVASGFLGLTLALYNWRKWRSAEKR